MVDLDMTIPSSDNDTSFPSTPDLPPTIPEHQEDPFTSPAIPLKEKGTFFSIKAKDIDLSKAPGLESSGWNKENISNILSKPAILKPTNFTSDFSDFSSDPITADTFKTQIQPKPLSPLVTGRKRNYMATPINEYRHTKAIRLNDKIARFENENENKEYTTAKDAVLGCRDLLIKAYSLTKNRKTQSELLDLLEVFRHYTEKGKVRVPIVTTTSTKEWEQNAVQTHKVPPKQTAKEVLTSTGKTLTPTASEIASKQTKTVSEPRWIPVTRNGKGKKPATTAKASNDKSGGKISSQQSRADKILTIKLLKDGLSIPKYDAAVVRNTINQKLGKTAIERVHTSPNKNIVLTCHNSTPDELLEKKDLWISVTNGWSIVDIQKVNNWPKLVVHGVPVNLSMKDIKNEIAEFNQQMKLEGEPRWLVRKQNKMHASLVISVQNEDQKAQIRKSGLLISGTLLRVVNYRSSTNKTQCHKCLKFGHQATSCNRQAVCAYCNEPHLTSSHSCGICKSSEACQHISKKCVNCKSNTHTALEHEHCEYYKAIS